MNEKQKWALIGATWIIAISCFMFVLLNRYAPAMQPASIDKWTGKIVVK